MILLAGYAFGNCNPLCPRRKPHRGLGVNSLSTARRVDAPGNDIRLDRSSRRQSSRDDALLPAGAVLALLVAEALRSNQTWTKLVRRAVLASVGSVAAIGLTILPFWFWLLRENVSQLPIDHQSRHNFLNDFLAQDQYFWAEHGILAARPVDRFATAPKALSGLRAVVRAGNLPFVIGLGGTTPVPRLLFGPFWEWLTYDRFSMWADVPLLVLFGVAASAWLDRRQARTPAGHDELASEARAATSWRTARGAAWPMSIVLLGLVASADALLPALIQSEPVPIDPGQSWLS